MRILVTGGAGYIGSHAVRLLLEHGHEITVFDNLSRGHPQAVPRELLVQADLHDIHRLDQVLLNRRIEAVIHFAALAQVGESVKNPALYYKNNLAGTLALLDCMQRAGVKRFIFSSTCATYGAPEKMPISEDCPQIPVNPYGRTKLAVEWALSDYALASDWACVSLRYFNAAGAHPAGDIGENHHPETHLIPLALFAAAGSMPKLVIFGNDYPTPDGACIRDYIHVEDLAEAHRLALEKVPPGQHWRLNLGTGKGSSVTEVLTAAGTVVGKKVPFTLGQRREGDPPELVANATRAREILGWKPVYTELEAIVDSAWKWHRLHPRGYQ
ncbi:MAG: UDP-glucose 4-epimerase GalE [Gemmataceae bacterium]|nr:UDP-glucose 4-epimerase GalE [Gemmataceae bacterium]